MEFLFLLLRVYKCSFGVCLYVDGGGGVGSFTAILTSHVLSLSLCTPFGGSGNSGNNYKFNFVIINTKDQCK